MVDRGTEQIRVLHIIKSLGRGGAEMLLPECLRLHSQDQYEFHYIYFLPWKDQMVESIERYGGMVTCLSARNNIALMFKVRAVLHYLRKHRIQIIHAHLPWAGILSRIVGKISGIPVIYTEHNKQERYHFATRFANLITMNLLTEVIAVSGDVEESVRKNKHGLTIPLKTIVNGVNTEHFNPAMFDRVDCRRVLGIPLDATVIGTVAVFRSQKRLSLWIEIASRILAKEPTLHFIIVGDGPLRGELIKAVKDLDIVGRVHFPGLMEEVRPYLATFDIFMMCSLFEGLPLALLEAMAMECAVISTNAGGIGEVVRDGVDGMLCGVDEPHKLVDYALKLISNPDLREGLAHQARKRVIDRFSLIRMVSQLEENYSTLAAR